MKTLLDLTGQQYGELTVIKKVRFSNHQSIWLCQCSCGKQIEIGIGNLRSGNSQSCGHDKFNRMAQSRHNSRVNLIGKRFGRLVVISEINEGLFRMTGWLCQCDCGNTAIALTGNLNKGATKSCGCLRREIASQNHSRYKHGLTGTPEYDKARKNKRRERKRNLDSQWTYQMEKCLRSLFKSCVVCGSADRMTTDHVLPLSKGHGLYPGNAVRLCVHCNSKKQAQSIDSLSAEIRTSISEAAIKFKEYWDQQQPEKEVVKWQK